MTSHRYPTKSLTGDYIRGLIGFSVTGLLLLSANMLMIIQYIFIVLTIFFGGFIFRTWLKQNTTLEISNHKIESYNFYKKTIYWNDITKIQLRYFSTRRDRTQGWFHLTLKSSKNSLSVDSNLEGFQTLLARCSKAISDNQLEISQTTLENFQSADIPILDGLITEPMPSREREGS